VKPVRLETRWRAVDSHLKKYCRELAAKLINGDGHRQRAPRTNDRLKFELAVEVIVCNLVALALSQEEHRSIAVIRANHASRLSKVYGKPFNRAVALMEEAGFVTTEVGYRHDRWSRASSSITATPEMTIPVVSGWDALELSDHEHLITLNTDGERPAAPQRHSRQPPRIERELIAINKHLCTARVEYEVSPLHVASWSSTITDRLVTPYHRQLHRVFKGDYASGGRLYGGWWQTLPRERREHIRIDNEAVANVDFSAMYLRLAYAKEGYRPPPGDGDLYDLTGMDHLRPDWQALREGRKKLVSAMFTSKRPLRQWPGATPREREDIQRCFPKGARVKHETTAIRERHKAIADWLECGWGLRLQRTESDILVAVLLKLIALGITALPIHDAVLVAKSHAETAQRTMEAEARKATGAVIPAKISAVEPQRR
jgi:hypothetical protein